jgi:aldehyde oxidoreductase
VTGLTKCAFSNHAFSTAYRGFGSPQTYTASEQLIDMLAEKAGIDPWEFRYRNVYKPGQDNNSGQKMPVYTLGTLLDMIKPKYEALKKRAEKLSTDTKKRGVGLACAGYNVSGAGDRSEVGLKLNPDNTVTAFNCWEDQGQGSDVGTLVHAHESLRPLGLRPDQIHVVQNDTNLGTNTGPAGGSRSHYMAGNAYIVTANLLMDAMRKPDGTYRTYDEMVEEDIPTSYISAWSVPPELACKLDPNTGVGLNTPEYNFGVYAVEVEVDTETGKVKCTAMNMVADCGVIGNRVSVDGQAFGGNSHCIGFALTEDYYDVKKHVDMISCGIPSIEDIPDGDDFTVEYLETPRPSGPHGSSGCSEMFQSAGHVAVINAINDAVGVRVYQLPATPDKILAGLSGKNLMPDRFYLGGNFEDVVADIKANPV